MPNILAPFRCRFCGADSWIDPSDQTPPPDYCHESDHGSDDDRAAYRVESNAESCVDDCASR